MAAAVIIGGDDALGGYLARLLQARGNTVFVTLEGGTGALAALGSLGDVNVVPETEVAALLPHLADATMFAISDGTAARAAAVAELATIASRLVHVVEDSVLASAPAAVAQARAVAERRRATGDRAINALLHAHDSRLGPADSLPAIITAAAWRAGQGQPGQDLQIAETGPRDWGWTPEYVDAIARAATMATPVDLAIGTGHPLSAADFVTHAFQFFRADPAGHVRIRPGGTEAPPFDAARLKAATGWSASTWGRDLVRALCEGAAARAMDRGA